MRDVEASLPIEGWRVEALTSKHQRLDFDCGEASLNEYLWRYVSQDAKRSLARAFVLTKSESPSVLGYYTLSATSIQRERFPTTHSKKLPRYPIPAVLLGRLAVDQSLQGKGVGEYLLIDALKRAALASATIGIHAVVIDAISDKAAKYYQRFGFMLLAESTRTVFLPIETILMLP